jgi:large subunit ribosomal protein L25
MPVLKVTKRDERGSRQVRRLRGQGLIPAVIYGHKQEPQAVSLSQHEVDLAVLHGERLLEVDFDGKTQNALIKDVQYDVYGKKILHVDLTWVDLD